MQATTQTGGVARRLALALTMASAVAVMVAACGSGGGSGTGGASTAAAPSSSASAGGSGGGTAAGVPDPCKVVTATDATQLTGKTLTQTGNSTLTPNSANCIYSAGATTVTVTVAQLPGATPAKADAYYRQAVGQFSHAPGVTLTHPGIGDKSLAGTASLGGFRESAIAFLKGTVYVSILTTSNASQGALKSLAVTALGRV